MKSQALGMAIWRGSFFSRRNRSSLKALRSKLAARRLLLETLEPRQVMTIVPVDGTPFGDFDGNFHPQTHAQYGTTDYLSPPASGDPLTIAKNYLTQNAGLYGLSAADIAHMTVNDVYTDAKTGESHVYFQQTYNNMPVADASASVNLSKNGRVTTAAASFVSGLVYPTTSIPLQPTVARSAALTAYANHAGLTPTGSIQVITPPTGNIQKGTFKQTGLASGAFTAQLQYVPKPGGGLDLAWEIIAMTPDQSHAFDTSIAAAGTRAGQVIRVVDNVWNDFYQVFPQSPVPVQDPTFGSQAIVVNPADPVASPFGWHDIDGVPGADFIDTRGNNVQAQTDINGDNTFGSPDIRPTDPNLQFTATTDFTQGAAFNQNAGVLNAFYWANLSHDVLDRHGFDEPAGNMQFKNYSGTTPFNGVSLDPLQLDTRDPAADLAAIGPHIIVTPDGISPRMQLGDNNFVLPSRDSSFDATIVAHEYFHAVSTRLTGGSQSVSELNALQSGGMGEGWSDWFALLMTMKATDTPATPRISGPWYLGGFIGGVGGGVREFPYSFDMTVNPHTLADFNLPVDPTLPFPASNGGSESHNAGELWASTLWDMTWLLINRYGFDANLTSGTGGQSKALDLVIDGLKMQPVNPSFLDARDAIIAADFQLNGGENYDLIWQAFARRGFGNSSNVGSGANSAVVAEAFDVPLPLARVEGTVFNDSNGNAKRDATELGVAGWTVYADLNNNGVLDPASEKQAQTDANGEYHFVFSTNQTVTIREILQTNFKQTTPKNNAGVTVSVSRGNIAAADFGVQGLPGQITGLKWNDLNGNGVRDTDVNGVLEPGLQGVVIYVDYNNDGKLNVLEPSTTTDRNGRYTINVPAGIYSIREVLGAGLTQTFPDPTGINGFGYTNVAVASSQVISLDFGNVASLDFGDAPDSYGTLLPLGPRHGILPGFFLGASVDPESNGLPTADATGDDVSNLDDEDGVSFGNAPGASPTVSPGLLKTIAVTVSTGGNSAGKLQGWIDFNRDGDFNDPGEKIISNLALGAGTHNVSFTPPTTASGQISLGATFARFRYGYETDLGPTGGAQAGEVEDYALLIQPDVPSAVDDTFEVKQGTPDPIILDVVANDPTTSFGPPSIVANSFPAVLASGSTLTLSNNKLIYKPASGFLGTESFNYRVTDGNSESGNGKVTINVIVRDPRAIDDTYTVAAQPGAALPITLGPGDPLVLANTNRVIDNDLTAHPAATHIITGLDNPNFSISGDEKTLIFTPPSPGFTGTQIVTYTIADDNSPLTSQARVTVQVVSAADQAAASHRAQMNVDILKLNPVTHVYEPATTVDAGSLFLVRVSAQDLRPANDFLNHPATNLNRGVEAAYLDLQTILTNPTNLANPDSHAPSFFASPVLSQGNPQGMAIVFDGSPSGVTAAVQTVTNANTFSGDPSLDPAGNFINKTLVFTSGALQGQMGRIISYDGATRTFVFGTNSFTAAPQAGDTFSLDTPLYANSDFGTPNAPAQGDIDEAGATHFDATGNPVGLGAKVVFSVLMRANAATPVGQPLQIIADPADQDPSHQIILAGDTTDPQNPKDPEKISNADDGKVFYRASAPLTITGANPEFTNLANPFDVNADDQVTPLDALLIINDINVNGGGTVKSASLLTTANSSSSTRTYFDVNKDQQVAPIDALLVINYLNGLKITAHSGSGGEGEGAALDSSVSAAAADMIYADLYSSDPKKKA